MDGGLDAAIRDALGFAVQQRAQRVIVERHHGERTRSLAVVTAAPIRRYSTDPRRSRFEASRP
jgi:O-acetyl-ADP-ribose deacetylase (regulator of RNase III)